MGAVRVSGSPGAAQGHQRCQGRGTLGAGQRGRPLQPCRCRCTSAARLGCPRPALWTGNGGGGGLLPHRLPHGRAHGISRLGCPEASPGVNAGPHRRVATSARRGCRGVRAGGRPPRHRDGIGECLQRAARRLPRGSRPPCCPECEGGRRRPPLPRRPGPTGFRLVRRGGPDQRSHRGSWREGGATRGIRFPCRLSARAAFAPRGPPAKSGVQVLRRDGAGGDDGRRTRRRRSGAFRPPPH